MRPHTRYKSDLSVIIIKPMLLLALAGCAQLAVAQCATEEQAKASIDSMKDEFSKEYIAHRSALGAVLAQVDATGAELGWDASRRAGFIHQMMNDPAMLRLDDRMQVQREKNSRVNKERSSLKGYPGAKAMCPIMLKYRAPHAAIARLNREQVTLMKAAVAGMKR